MRPKDGFSASARHSLLHAKPQIEPLETRKLLSTVQTPLTGSDLTERVARTMPVHAADSARHDLPSHPLIESMIDARGGTAPPYYPLYRGPKQPNLHVLSTFARLFNGRGFVFTGTVIGRINYSQTQFYVFGINRGGAKSPGPFPLRPGITFDAEIIVATNSNGFSGSVVLLNNKGQQISSTSLPQNAVVFSGVQVKVALPLNLLPPTSPAGTPNFQDHYTFAFWAGKSPSAPGLISGFAPQYVNRSPQFIGFSSP